MRFKPTILINENTIEKIINGEIKLQTGQWIQLAWLNKKSRFVGITFSGDFWAVDNKRFSSTVKIHKFPLFS